MTRQRAAEHLQVHINTIDGFAKRGMLPRYYLPSASGTEDVSPRFRIEDLEAILAQR